MILARVTGKAVATRKEACFEGKKLLRIQPVDLDGSAVGSSFLAFDSVDAGHGDVVLVVQEGGSANSVAGTVRKPLDAVIVAVVDTIELDAT
ncbi:MAG: EutN/CcmL family microcompartment protein [Candidatus Schekmanbacteria bacterium]|nr:EutN/CcmL family microcompartment protein [Candidatus Schekmanbacteria bacterium]